MGPPIAETKYAHYVLGPNYSSHLCCRMSGKTQDFKIGICCFSVKHTALRSKSNDWLTLNQDNAAKWSNMSTDGLLFQ